MRCERWEVTVSVATVSSIIAVVLALTLVVWYAAANRRWIRLLHEQEPSLAVDPIARPTQWATTAPARLRRMWALFKTPSDGPRLEQARLRTVHRAVAACGLGPLLMFGLPVFSTVMVAYTRAVMDRDLMTAVTFIAAMGAIVAYWGWRLARAMFRYGNGEFIRLSEAVVPVAGIAAATLMAASMSGSLAGGRG